MICLFCIQGCKRREKVTRCHPGPPTASSQAEAMKKTLPMLVWWLLPGRAQDAISLRDAVRLALEKNQSVAASTATEKGAESRIAEARGGNLPKVNYSESWTRSDNPVFVFSIKTVNKNRNKNRDK